LPQQALYLKWRPALFNEVVGQEHITRTLRNALKSGRVRHAYLFSGPRGTGKTTTARLLAKAVNCTHPDPDVRPCNECATCLAVNEGRFLDLIEIDAATHTGVDDVRDLRDKIAFSPGEGRFKVYIIDEVHRFSGSAFDALLKTLEEPPEHAIFVLATTEIDKVPPTIKSRCLQFEFRRFSVQEVADRLQLIIEGEGMKAERAALEMIARQGTGSMRDSISLLDQIVTDPVELISLELVQRVLGTASSAAVKDLVERIIAGSVAEGLRVINAAVDNGTDPRQFGQQMVEYLRCILLAQTAGAEMIEASAEERAVYTDQAGRIGRTSLIRAIRAFNEAITSSRSGWQPQLPLELALIESVRGGEGDDAPAATMPNLNAQIAAQVAAQIAQLSGQMTAQPGTQPLVRPAETPKAEEFPHEAAGKPPVVPLAVLREKWGDMLKALVRRNRTAPALLENFRPYHAEGNWIYLGTDNSIYLERLQHPQKLEIVEQAFYDVHHVKLKVKVVLVGEGEAPSVGDGQPGEGRAPHVNDPLIEFGISMGAEVHPRKDRQKE
jgi:DNA polymerase III subunit gamma/tau